MYARYNEGYVGHAFFYLQMTAINSKNSKNQMCQIPLREIDVRQQDFYAFFFGAPLKLDNSYDLFLISYVTFRNHPLEWCYGTS